MIKKRNPSQKLPLRSIFLHEIFELIFCSGKNHTQTRVHGTCTHTHTHTHTHTPFFFIYTVRQTASFTTCKTSFGSCGQACLNRKCIWNQIELVLYCLIVNSYMPNYETVIKLPKLLWIWCL